MFGRVAPRYDLLNHLLSGQVDRYWRRRLVREVRRYLAKDSVRVADLCCGTGDLALALEHERRRLGRSGGPPLLASDFCRPMLRRAKRKMSRAGYPCLLAEADATRMPLPDGCLELITIAFGLRNLTNYLSAAREFARLLAGGGCLAVLEFSRPTSVVWGRLFEAYFRHVLPRLGNAISGSGGAYSYLQESVQRFPGPRRSPPAAARRGVWARRDSLSHGRSQHPVPRLRARKRGPVLIAGTAAREELLLEIAASQACPAAGPGDDPLVARCALWP